MSHTRAGGNDPAYYRYTSLGTARTFATMAGGSMPAGATRVLVQPETQSVRWRDDGTAPTATVGNLIPANTVVEFGGKLASVQIIETAGSATVNLNFYQD